MLEWYILRHVRTATYNRSPRTPGTPQSGCICTGSSIHRIVHSALIIYQLNYLLRDAVYYGVRCTQGVCKVVTSLQPLPRAYAPGGARVENKNPMSV